MIILEHAALETISIVLENSIYNIKEDCSRAALSRNSLVAEQLSDDHSEEGKRAKGQATGSVHDTPGKNCRHQVLASLT